MSCKTCFEDWICKCVPYSDFIVLNTNVPAGDYTYFLTDKNEHKYSGVATREADGTLTIPIADFPDGFFTEYSGSFKIEIFTDEGCTPVPILLAKKYDCIEFDVKGGTFEKNEIGCVLP